MNLRQLELFIAIAESGSFSRGAEQVLLTQSTVSQHIASLESGNYGVWLPWVELRGLASKLSSWVELRGLASKLSS